MSELPIPMELRCHKFGRNPEDGSKPVFPNDIPEILQFVEDIIQDRHFNRRLAERLRDNTRITHLGWVTGYTSQFMLDCIATIKSLEVLSIGISRAADLSGIGELSKLKCLSLDTTGPATDLSPICRLQNLVSLSIGVSKRITTLDAFSTNSLSSLRALHLAESSYSVTTFDSLEPLGAIESLEYLALGQVRSKDRSLAAIAALPSLRAFQYDRNAKFESRDLDTLKSRGIDVSTF
ncbi:MAG: hypothetical protein QNI99_04855 [Woeseiaceae bacterium]|nr:hypothetical protein [Woeseiaceae bacterium]